MKSLQDRIVSARVDAGKSQKEVADFIGISQPSYSELETGKTQRTKYIGEIAYFLGVNAYWLATGNGPRDQKLPDQLYQRICSLSEEKQQIIKSVLDGFEHPEK